MSNQLTEQAMIVSQAQIVQSQGVTLLALFDQNGDPIDLSGGGGTVTVSWGDIADKPAVIAAGADAEEARSAIGAGTSNVSVGNTAPSPDATTGSAGSSDEAARADHVHPKLGANNINMPTYSMGTSQAVTNAHNVQEAVGILEARIKALEDAA